MLRILAVFAVVPALAACSTSSPTSGSCSVQGTVGGAPLDAKDCFSRALASDPDYSAELTIADFSNACSMDVNQTYKANSSTLDMHFIGSPPLAPGTYPTTRTAQTGVPDTHTVDANLSRLDHSCKQQAVYPADGGSPLLYPVMPTGGAVTVTRADSSGIDGTFDLTFGSDHITGSFHAPSCGPQAKPASCVQ